MAKMINSDLVELLKDTDELTKATELQEWLKKVHDRSLEIIDYSKVIADRIENNLDPIIVPKIYHSIGLDNANPYDSPMHDIILEPNVSFLYIMNIAIRSYLAKYKFEASKDSEELNMKYWLLIAKLDIYILSDYRRLKDENYNIENIRISRNNNLLLQLKDKNNYPEDLELLTENDLDYLNKYWYKTGPYNAANLKVKNTKDVTLTFIMSRLDVDDGMYINRTFDDVDNIQIISKIDYPNTKIEILNLKTDGELCSIKDFVDQIYSKFNVYLLLLKLTKNDYNFSPYIKYTIDNSKSNSIRIIFDLECKKYIDESKKNNS